MYVKWLGATSFFLNVNQLDFRARSANAVYEGTWVTSLYVIFATSIIFAWRGKTNKNIKLRGNAWVYPLDALWTADEREEDAARECDVFTPDGELVRASGSAQTQETLTLRFHDERVPVGRSIVYTRVPEASLWHFQNWDASENSHAAGLIPAVVRIIPEELLPLRVAKTRTHLREHLLRRVHACHKVKGNLLLFKCTTCKERFITFHPKHVPEMPLNVLATYPNNVAKWDSEPAEERTKEATFHKGQCQRCADSLKKLKETTLCAKWRLLARRI